MHSLVFPPWVGPLRLGRPPRVLRGAGQTLPFVFAICNYCTRVSTGIPKHGISLSRENTDISNENVHTTHATRRVGQLLQHGYAAHTSHLAQVTNRFVRPNMRPLLTSRAEPEADLYHASEDRRGSSPSHFHVYLDSRAPLLNSGASCQLALHVTSRASRCTKLAADPALRRLPSHTPLHTTAA